MYEVLWKGDFSDKKRFDTIYNLPSSISFLILRSQHICQEFVSLQLDQSISEPEDKTQKDRAQEPVVLENSAPQQSTARTADGKAASIDNVKSEVLGVGAEIRDDAAELSKPATAYEMLLKAQAEEPFKASMSVKAEVDLLSHAAQSEEKAGEADRAKKAPSAEKEEKVEVEKEDDALALRESPARQKASLPVKPPLRHAPSVEKQELEEAAAKVLSSPKQETGEEDRPASLDSKKAAPLSPSGEVFADLHYHATGIICIPHDSHMNAKASLHRIIASKLRHV